MGNPQWVTVMTPFGFYPIGEVYSVIPKWDEWHSVTQWVANPLDAPNRYSIIGSFEDDVVSFTLSLRDTTDEDNPVPPSVDVTVANRVWLQDGFVDERGFDIEPVMTEPLTLDEEPVWTGDIRVVMSRALRTWLGVQRPARFSIDVIFSDDLETTVRIAYGTLVLRR